MHDQNAYARDRERLIKMIEVKKVKMLLSFLFEFCFSFLVPNSSFSTKKNIQIYFPINLLGISFSVTIKKTKQHVQHIETFAISLPL